MGDNALSILIQAKIDEASATTIQNQLKTLQKNLNKIKISLDLGDIKNQFANMFKEIAKEAERQQINATGKHKASTARTQYIDFDEAIQGAKKLDAQFQTMLEKVKEFGKIKSVKEVFSSASEDVKQVTVEVEALENGLKQLKTIDIFKNVTKNENGELEDVYQLGDLRVKTQEITEEVKKTNSAMQDTKKILNETISFTGTQEEAMKKVVVHAGALDDNLQNVREVVKNLGTLTNLTETFSSADGSLTKMKAKVEEVSGTLKQVKTVEVFKTLNQETGDIEYTMGKVTVQTKEFGMSLEQLQKAGKGVDYTKLYNSLEKFINNAEHATIVAKELNDAIYTQKGQERKSFQKLDANVQEEYLKVLKLAQQRAKDTMAKEHEEALKMNQEYNNKLVAELKKAEVTDLAHYRKLQENARNNQAVMDAIHESALEEHKRRLQQERDIDKAHAQALEMNRRVDAKEQAQQGNVNIFKSQMNSSINSLLATNNVDTSRIEALRASMENLDGKTKNVRQAMQEMRMELQSIAQDSTKFTTATANMGQLETEIHNVTDSFKIGKITLEEYIQKLNGLMKNESGGYSDAFINSVGMDKAIQYIQQLENAQKSYNQQLKDEQVLHEKIEQQLLKLNQINNNSKKMDKSQYNQLVTEYNQLRDAIKNGNITMDEAKNKFQTLGAQMKTFENQTKTLNTSSNKLFNTFKMLIGVYSMFDAFNLGKRAIKDMVNEVRELDSALVSMNKVAMLSDEQLRAFVSTATEIGDAVGRTTSQVVDATAEFIKMGESVEDASTLAKNALMYMNVGDLTNTQDATGTMISAMKAFGIEAKNSLQIVDKINNVANNFAIDAKGIGAGLQRASSALAVASNDIDETLAMMAVGNQVVQDPESLAMGLRTISMRLRNLSEDGGELESKMEDVFATYANGVKIMNDDGSYKSTFEILRDLGEEWDNLNEKQKSFLGEKIAGKNRANIFFAIMENAKDLNKALETAQNSMGSAEAENERFMNSIEGKITQLQSAWQALANTTVNSEFVKSIVDATTATVKFIDACGGLIPVLIGVGTAILFIKTANVAGGVGALISQLLSLKLTAEVTTLALNALNIAKMGLVGGAIVAGVMAVGAGIHYIATSSERAEKKINDLKSSISSLTEEQKTVEELWTQFERLSTIEPSQRSDEQEQKYLDVMNQIKQLVPEVNGYYNEQGNFIITSTEALKEYIQAKEEKIRLDKEELAQESEKKLINLGAEIEQQKEKNDLAQEYLNMLDRNDRGEKLTKQEAVKFTQLRAYFRDAQNAQRQYDEGYKAMQSSLNTYREKLMDVLAVEEDFVNLKDDEKNAIKEAFAEADYDLLKTVYEDAKNGTEGYVQKLKELDVVQKIINKNLEETKEKVGTVYEARGIEELQGDFQSITDEIQELNDVLDDLNNGNGITAKSLKKIISTYPELLEHIHSEVDLRNAIQQKMTEQKDVQQQVYNQMLAATDNYYHNVMLKDTEWRTKSENNIKKLFESLGLAYEDDFRNYANAERAKAEISQQLINGLGTAWGNYYQQMSKAYAGGSSFQDFLKTQKDYDTMSAGKVQQLEKVWEAQQQVADTFNSFQFEHVKVDVGGSSKSASTGREKKNSDNEVKPSYISSIYQEKVDAILEGGKKIEEAMAMVEAKLDNARAVGNEQLADKLQGELLTLQVSLRDKQASMAKELDAQLKEMAEILSNTGVFKEYDINKLTAKDMATVIQKIDSQINTATLKSQDKEVNRLNLLKSKINDVGQVYLKTMEQRRELSRIWWEEDTARLAKQKEIIQDTYDKQSELIDNAIRDIELEQKLYKEGSEQYIELEKRKYAEVLKQQKIVEEALDKMRKANISKNEEQAKKYYDIWYDAESKKRDMIKSIQEQVNSLRKEQLETQIKEMEDAQNAIKEIIDATVKLIKQEQEAKKKAINDELDGYKKIIDAKKEALQKDKSDKDYKKSLEEKQAEITKVENKILELQNDNSLSAKKKRQEYEEQLVKLKGELNDMQEEHSLNSALDALDKEYEAFEETQNKKIEEIDNYLSQEGKLRQDAIKRIENDNQKLYKELLEWNRQYGTAIDEDITNAWNTAMDGMKKYGEGQNSVLSTIENIVDKLKEANDEIKMMNQNSGFISSDAMIDGSLSTNPDDNSTVIPTGEAYQKLIDEVAPQMNRNSDEWHKTTDENKRQELAKENERLAKKIGAWKRSDGLWYVMSNNKVVSLKSLYPNYHTGGIVGGNNEAKLKSTEQFATLLKGEAVATESQMEKFMKVTYPKMLNLANIKAENNGGGSINIDRFVDITVQGNLDSTVDLEGIIKKASQRAIDTLVNTMSNMGLKGRVI